MSEHDATLAALPYAAYLGLRIDDSGALWLPFRADLVGNYHIGALHGGVVAAALECAALVWLRRETAAAPRTIDLTIDYLRPAVSRDLHFAVAPIRVGRAVATVRVDAWQADPARPVAAGHGNFRLIAD
ncbi:PaaI family thioesterase [Immundisolibacter sp.]